MTIHIRTRQIILQQPASRTIHPNMHMRNPDFLRGYTLGLKEGLHPESGKAAILSDEDVIEAISTCLADDPESLPGVLGNYIGLIIGRCH